MTSQKPPAGLKVMISQCRWQSAIFLVPPNLRDCQITSSAHARRDYSLSPRSTSLLCYSGCCKACVGFIACTTSAPQILLSSRLLFEETQHTPSLYAIGPQSRARASVAFAVELEISSPIQQPCDSRPKIESTRPGASTLSDPPEVSATRWPGWCSVSRAGVAICALSSKCCSTSWTLLQAQALAQASGVAFFSTGCR